MGNIKGKTKSLEDRIAITRQFLKGKSVKALAAKYNLAAVTISSYIRNHVNVNGRIISKPPEQSKEIQLPGEEWKRVPFFSLYLFEASNFGRIRSYAYGKPKIVPGSIRSGYRAISYFSKAGKKMSLFAHIMIAKAWLPARPSLKHVVAHLDHDKFNNYPSNLKWMPKSIAQQLARQSPYMVVLAKRVRSLPEDERRSSRYGKLTRKDVIRIKNLLHNKRRIVDIAREYKVATETITRIHRGRSWPDVLPHLSRKKIVVKVTSIETKQKIIAALHAGMSGRSTAKMYGVDATTVTRIKKSLKQ